MRIFELVSTTEKDKTMNLKNKATVIATSVIAVAAIAIASPALASKNNAHSTSKITSKSVSTAAPTPTATTTPPTFGNGGGFGDNDGDGPGKHGRGDGPGKHGRGDGPRGSFTPITKTVTVDVPATGTYKLLVTEVAPANAPTPPAGAPVRPAESFTVAVTGTGSQTVTLNLPHPGNYTVALISVVSTQDVTAN